MAKYEYYQQRASISTDGVNDVFTTIFGTLAMASTGLTPMFLTAWVKFGAVASQPIVNHISGVSPNEKGFRWFLSSSGKPSFAIGSLLGPGLAVARTSNTALSTDTWYHLAVTYAGGTPSVSGTAIKLFVNGVETAYSQTTSGDPTMTVVEKTLTMAIDTYTSKFAQAEWAQVAGWNNRNATPEMIRRMYNNGRVTDPRRFVEDGNELMLLPEPFVSLGGLQVVHIRSGILSGFFLNTGVSAHNVPGGPAWP